jgi:hypothetical protein
VSFAERIYRAALAGYPADYRVRRGDEVLGTLLDANQGRRLPDARELASIMADGYRRRVLASVGPTHGALRAGAAWAAYALAVLTAAVAVVGVMREDRLAQSLPPALAPNLHVLGIATNWWFAAFSVTAVATLAALAASARRTALALSIAGVLVQAWETAFAPAAGFPGAHGHFAAYAWTDVSTLPRQPWHWLVASLVLAACAAAPADGRRPVRVALAARLVLSVGLVAGLAVAMDTRSGVAAGLIFALVPMVALALALSPVDPRPALACIPLLVAALPLVWAYVVDPTTPATGGTGVLVGILLAALALAVASAFSTRRLRGAAPPRS